MRLRLSLPLASRDEVEALLTADKATVEERELEGAWAAGVGRGRAHRLCSR